jgi:hypothetical protein
VHGIQTVKSALRKWLDEAEKAPNFKTLLQNKSFELRDEMESAGLAFRESEDVLENPGPGGAAYWRAVRAEFHGRGRSFSGMQLGQDGMACFNALCIAYLKAKEWLSAKREAADGEWRPARSADQHEVGVEGVVELDHDNAQGGEPEQLYLHEQPSAIMMHEHPDAHQRQSPQKGRRKGHGQAD